MPKFGDQLTMFERAKVARRARPLVQETSREAKASMGPHLNRIATEVLNAIKFVGPMACHEVEELLPLRHTTASARIRELVKKGLLEDSGLKRKTPSGRNAIVWRAK